MSQIKFAASQPNTDKSITLGIVMTAAKKVPEEKEKTPATTEETAAAPEVKKFEITDEIRLRCEIYKLDARMRDKFIPLHKEFLRCLIDAENVSLAFYIISGWDLIEYMKPGEYHNDRVKEMLQIIKEYPTTRLAIKRDQFPRYENLMNAYRNKRYEKHAEHFPQISENFVKDRYNNLCNTSQSLVRGALDEESFFKVTHAASEYILKIPKTQDVVNFLIEVVGHDPHLYDHAACTSLLAGCISYNSLQLPKRESKLTVQASFLHDIERNCSYLLKAPNLTQISLTGAKDIKAMIARGIKFHETTLTVMHQYREHFAGGGVPGKKHGRCEEQGEDGILRMSRVVALACGLTEFLLKRMEKLPLKKEKIFELLRERAGVKYDPIIIDEFFKDLENPKVRKKITDELEEQNDDLLFEFAGDMFKPEM